MLACFLHTNNSGWIGSESDIVAKELNNAMFEIETIGEEYTMLTTILVILAVLWLLGMVTSYTAGGLIHLLLVIAVIGFLFNFFSGRRV